MNVTKHVTFCNVKTAVAANTTLIRPMSYIHRTSSHVKHDRSIATYGRLELDSHADTIVLGSNAVVLQCNRECDVAPYSDLYDPICNVPIVTGATAATSTEREETIILVFYEAIWMLVHLVEDLDPRLRHGHRRED